MLALETNKESNKLNGRVNCTTKNPRTSFEKEKDKFYKFAKITKTMGGIVISLSLAMQGPLVNSAAANEMDKNIKASQNEQAVNHSTNNEDIIIAVIDHYSELPDSKRIIKLDEWSGQGSSIHGTKVVNEVEKTLDELENVVGPQYTDNIKILPISLGSDGFKDIPECMTYAVDNGADVINISIVGNGYDKKEQQAVDYAYENDVVVVAAAGNEGKYKESFPAQDSRVVSVAAIKSKFKSGKFETASYSQKNEGIDFGEMEGSYEGTSFTAPQVAAKMAVIREGLERKGVKPEVDRVIEAAKEAANNSKRDEKTGWGMINVKKVIENINKGNTSPVKDIEPPHAIFEQKGDVISFEFFDDRGSVDTSNLNATIESNKLNLAKDENLKFAKENGKFIANLGSLPNGEYKIIMKGAKDSAGNSADIIREFDMDTKPLEFNITSKISDNKDAVDFGLSANDEFGITYRAFMNHKICMRSNCTPDDEVLKSPPKQELTITQGFAATFFDDGLNIFEFRANDGTFTRIIKYGILKENGKIVKVKQLSTLVEKYNKERFDEENCKDDLLSKMGNVVSYLKTFLS